jgi:hypothetical protein
VVHHFLVRWGMQDFEGADGSEYLRVNLSLNFEQANFLINISATIKFWSVVRIIGYKEKELGTQVQLTGLND